MVEDCTRDARWMSGTDQSEGAGPMGVIDGHDG